MAFRIRGLELDQGISKKRNAKAQKNKVLIESITINKERSD